MQYLPFHADSSFLLAFKKLWVVVWQHIITENTRLQEYFGLAHKFSTIMINAGSCPKYYFQNDKWLLNMEDKTSLNIFLKGKNKPQTSLPTFSFHSEEWRVLEVVQPARCWSSWFYLSCVALVVCLVSSSSLRVLFWKWSLLQPQGRDLIGQVLEVLCVNHTEL